MEKPTPITQEYVDYLSSLQPEILAEKFSELSNDDKYEIKLLRRLPITWCKVGFGIFGQEFQVVINFKPESYKAVKRILGRNHRKEVIMLRFSFFGVIRLEWQNTNKTINRIIA